MANRDSGSHVAVFFVNKNKVTQHMLFSEFEALLNGMGAMPGYSDEEAKAVYTVINRSGKIRALVFFTLYFDEQGLADPSWNIPIERLAEISGSGPDLGGGPIKLACRGQCSINWHLDDLWDPDMTPGSNDFLLIKKTVDENRLRFKFDAPEENIPTLSSVSDQTDEVDLDFASDTEKRAKLARLLKEQRLRIKTLESNRKQVVDSSDREQRIIIHAYKNEIQELEQKIEQLKVSNERLQEKLASRNEQFVSLQDKVSDQSKLVAALEKKLQSATGGDRDRLEKQKMEAQIVLLQEQLERRDMDLGYRNEREEQLRDELEELKELMVSSHRSDPLLVKLKALEIVYVAYHPGAGHITMSSADILDYVDSPMAFVAKKCSVTEDHYRTWLAHYEHAVCHHLSANGKECQQPVEKVGVPSDFVPEVNNFCKLHRRKDAD